MLGGSFKRLQFTPDLVPADLVGTRIFRPDTGGFDTELGPVFCNFLLADEINRAPAKVQSALLEVMQERQVTIGHDTHQVPAPFLVLATQNPIESEGTYPLPEAQVDRFMFKLVVDYPTHRDEVAVVERSLETGTRAREVLSPEQLSEHQKAAGTVYVDRRVMEYAVALTTATREPGDENWVEFGASPRGSINLIHAGRALALLRGRDYMLPVDVRDLARDVLRHRIVLTYEALAAGIDADRVLDDVLERVPMPRIELAQERPFGTSQRCQSDRQSKLPRRRRSPVLPGPLLLALRVPLAAGVYVLVPAAGAQVRGPLHERRLLAGVAGRSWTRHVPALLALLALAALLIAIARPQRTVAAERREATVILVFDTSGSMLATDVQPSRLAAAPARGQDVRRQRAGHVPDRRHRLRLERAAAGRADDRPRAREDDDQRAPGQGRDRDGRRAQARDQLGADPGAGRPRRRAPAAGGDRPARRRRQHPRRRTRSTSCRTRRSSRSRSTPSRSAPRTARSRTRTRTPARRPPSRVPPDLLTLQDIARDTGGQFFATADARRLQTVYANLGTRLTKTKEKQQVTSAFAGGALVLLLAGAGFGRLGASAACKRPATARRERGGRP